jgi:drug/metabolite transporter (DMT)-like permease
LKGLILLLYYLVCGLGVVAVSFAAIFIRSADAHPTLIALMRMSLATLVMGAMWLLRSRQLPRRRDWPWLMGSGVFLAMHFFTWISSFEHTSVTSSVVLVATQPLFVVGLSRVLFRERLKKLQALGLVLCILGTAIIGYSDVGSGGRGTLTGNALALGGAFFAALYWLVGRKVRQELSILPYTTTVYGFAALVLGAIALASGQALGPFTATTWGSFVGLALVCTVIGHSSLNYAIGSLSASFISVVALGEPIGAALWAALLFREIPTLGQTIGGLVVLTGITVFALAGREK